VRGVGHDATPLGVETLSIAWRSATVMRSWTCSRRAKTSTMRGILDRPMMRRRGCRPRARAVEGRQVVLAQAVELDVLDQHHLRAVLVKTPWPTTSSTVCELPCVSSRQAALDALGRARQSLAPGILAESVQQARMSAG
jgi:hypothetical protein